MASMMRFLSKHGDRATAVVLGLAGIALGPTAIAHHHDHGRRPWVGTWSASPHAVAEAIQFNGQTVREIVHTSVGGDRVRIRLSNAYGTSPLVIGAAHVSISIGGGSIAQETDRFLTFNGSPTIAIPGGALAVSDPVNLDVRALDDVAVSLFLPASVSATTQHQNGLQTTYISGPGNSTDAITVAGTTTQSYYFLTGVEVQASERTSAVVALGDSITDGFGSTPDTNQRWPNLLAERLLSHDRRSRLGVLNAGIIGNRILHDLVGTNALARLDRDVLVQTGARYVIVLEGINDFGIPGLIGVPAQEVTADELIQGHRQIIDRAHALGLTIYGATLTPVEGILGYPGFYSAALEEKRRAVNEWIRTSQAYDAVIDFDNVLRDPSHPTRLLAAFDSGDHAHPNDAGYRAMANAIDLRLFTDNRDF